MTNNNRVEWVLNGEIQAACESCKFPRHDGPCGSASSFLNQDKILTLNIGCEYCRGEFRRYHPTLCDLTVKLTNEERKPVFDNLQIHPDDFGGLSDVEGQSIDLLSLLEFFPLIDAYRDDEFKRQLKDSVHIMSSSGQDLWKTMFGNVEESIHLLCILHHISSHLFSHQMAYFLSAIDIGDKASFFSKGKIHCIPRLPRMEDMYMLIPIIGLDRIKARIENPVVEAETDALVGVFLYCVVKNQRELEQAGELDKVRELACKYGLDRIREFACKYGLDRIKARIENHVDKIETGALVRAFLYYVVKNQRELEQAGELDKDRVGEIACRFGMQYVHVTSHPSMFSLDGFCPLEIMKISTLNSSSRFSAINSSSRFKLRPQNVRASAQLVYKIDVHSQNIEVSINISNVRCRILSDKSSDQEKYFPSRIQIRVTPSKDCEMRTQSFRVGKSGNDPPRTLSKEQQWEAGVQLSTGLVDLKVGGKFGISTTHTNWRFEMNDCSANSSAGYFQWTLFDNANGVEVWSADSRNYKQLMHRGSSLRNRGSHLSSPFTSDGGCIFSEDLYGQPFTWSLDKRVEGTTSSWRVEMDVWLTYCYNVSRNDCFQTASWTFTESLEMKL